MIKREEIEKARYKFLGWSVLSLCLVVWNIMSVIQAINSGSFALAVVFALWIAVFAGMFFTSLNTFLKGKLFTRPRK